MSDLTKGLIGILIWSFLTLGSYNVSKSHLCEGLPLGKHVHLESSKSMEPANTAPPVYEDETPIRQPLDFIKSMTTPNTNAGYPIFKSNILKNKREDNILEITGYYYEDEKNTSADINLGLARANEVKKLFLKDIPDTRIRTNGAKFPYPEDMTNDFLDAVGFKWIKKSDATVEVFADRTIIRFPFNSVQKITDPAIDDYLNKLAKKIISTKEEVSLTGHTDNVGEPEVNVQLALRRAKMIRDLLIEKGVNRNQINTYSKGENTPIADNKSERGRQKNRRVVVRLIKKGL